MYTKSLLALSALTALVAAKPMPAEVSARDAATVNQPISDAEWQALRDGGLQRRDSGPDDSSSLVARDNVMNCGHLVTGKGGSGGHGKWVPLAQFASVAEEFCSAYVGTDIFLGHETSDTYPVTLTNQKDNTQPGPAGDIVFAIYNTAHTGTWVVDHDTCLRAMKAPLGNHISKRSSEDNVLSKRDYCYGASNNDYEGGYYKVNGIGAFGSEVYLA